MLSIYIIADQEKGNNTPYAIGSLGFTISGHIKTVGNLSLNRVDYGGMGSDYDDLCESKSTAREYIGSGRLAILDNEKAVTVDDICNSITSVPDLQNLIGRTVHRDIPVYDNLEYGRYEWVTDMPRHVYGIVAIPFDKAGCRYPRGVNIVKEFIVSIRSQIINTVNVGYLADEIYSNMDQQADYDMVYWLTCGDNPYIYKKDNHSKAIPGELLFVRCTGFYSSLGIYYLTKI